MVPNRIPYVHYHGFMKSRLKLFIESKWKVVYTFLREIMFFYCQELLKLFYGGHSSF